MKKLLFLSIVSILTSSYGMKTMEQFEDEVRYNEIEKWAQDREKAGKQLLQAIDTLDIARVERALQILQRISREQYVAFNDVAAKKFEAVKALVLNLRKQGKTAEAEQVTSLIPKITAVIGLLRNVQTWPLKGKVFRIEPQADIVVISGSELSHVK